MVARGDAYATLIDIIEAATLQQIIREKKLRITQLIERPFPYLVFFYTDDNNRKDVQKMISCLDKLSPSFMEMKRSDYIPAIEYTKMEMDNPIESFTETPYTGMVIIAIILALGLGGFIIEFFQRRHAKIKQKHGKNKIVKFKSETGMNSMCQDF